MPKHVGIDTYYELYFVIFILLFLLSAFICWLGVRSGAVG